MLKRTQTAVLASILISTIGMAFEVDESKIATPDEAIAALKAGNVEDINMIGSFEFAAALKHVKAIVVMGHTACGAVDGACQNAKLGNLTLLLDEIQPAVELVKKQHPNENVCDAPLVDDISEANVLKTVSDIRAKSTVIAELESEGKVKLVVAMYDVSTGKVRFL